MLSGFFRTQWLRRRSLGAIAGRQFQLGRRPAGHHGGARRDVPAEQAVQEAADKIGIGLGPILAIVRAGRRLLRRPNGVGRQQRLNNTLPPGMVKAKPAGKASQKRPLSDRQKQDIAALDAARCRRWGRRRRRLRLARLHANDECRSAAHPAAGGIPRHGPQRSCPAIRSSPMRAAAAWRVGTGGGFPLIRRRSGGGVRSTGCLGQPERGSGTANRGSRPGHGHAAGCRQ